MKKIYITLCLSVIAFCACSLDTAIYAQGWSKTYEIYPATEGRTKTSQSLDGHHLPYQVGCACHAGEECSFISKIDTAGNLVDLLELYKPGRRIQLGWLADILEVNGKLITTGDDSWNNDTLNIQTQFMYRFDQSLDTVERIHIPVEPQRMGSSTDPTFYYI
ncbi:hypothetical protein MASR1M65_29810 [Saprospiraceae bacterium]